MAFIEVWDYQVRVARDVLDPAATNGQVRLSYNGDESLGFQAIAAITAELGKASSQAWKDYDHLDPYSEELCAHLVRVAAQAIAAIVEMDRVSSE